MIRFSLAFFSVLTFVAFGQDVVYDAAFEGSIDSFEEEEFEQFPDYIPIRLGRHWGWYDLANEELSDTLVFTDFAQPESGFQHEFILKKGSKWGTMSAYGDEVLPFQYDSILAFDGQLLTLSEDTWNYHFRGDLLDSLIPISFDSLFHYDRNIYLFDNGKTGVILRNGTVIQPKYDGIRSFSCEMNDFENSYYLSLNGNEYNLLAQNGDEILPAGIFDIRCTEDGVIEFKRGEYPEYYVPYMNEFLAPNGRDVVFYKDEAYKLYNQEKTKSEYHHVDGVVLKDTYDDYFYLWDDYYAVRKGDKVGLTKNGTQLITPLKYTQITPASGENVGFDYQQNYFKFFLGDACGLMTKDGVELFNADYANILVTSLPNRFIVLDQEFGGVVDRNGRSIIPVKYDHIYFEQFINAFVVQLNNRIGVIDANGNIKIPVEYEAYRVFQGFSSNKQANQLIGLKKEGRYYFVNNDGFISEKGFDHYDHTPGILKTYDAESISVFIFDKRGKIEEKQEYPLFENAIIEEDRSDVWSILTEWNVSLIEEHQQNGYFGLRYYAKRGFGVKPTYRTIQPTVFGDVIGTVGMNSLSYDWIDTAKVEIIRCYDHLKTHDGSINTPTFFQSDLLSLSYASGDRHVNVSLGGGQILSYVGHMSLPTLDLSKRMLYSENRLDHEEYIKYFSGGSVRVCPIENAQMSLYDYYRYSNSISSLKFPSTTMKWIMNPKWGVDFEESEVGVINASFSGVRRKYISYTSTHFYEDFYFLGYNHFFEKEKGAELGEIRSEIRPKKYEEEVTILDVISAREVEGMYSDFMLVDVKSDQMAKIHTDFPNFLFVQDSVHLSYESARITQRIDSNLVQLVTPDGKIIADSCLLVRYLKQNRFAVLRNDGWEVLDTDGNPISDQKFTSVSDFDLQEAEFGLSDGSFILMNTDGEEVMPTPEPRVFLDDHHYYLASNPARITNRNTGVTDAMSEGEKYHSNGFFHAREDGKTIIRRFGSDQSISVKSTSKLKSFGTLLYIKKGKHHYSIDSTLRLTKHKKVEKIRNVTPEIVWLEGKKDQLIDVNWKLIHELSPDERFEIRDGNLFIIENDSVYQNLGSFSRKSELVGEEKQSPVFEVVQKNGKFGVQLGDTIILPHNYPWLSKINDQEYMTMIEAETRLYNSSLERIGDQPFDWFLQTDRGSFVFYRNQDTFVVSEDLKSTIHLNVSLDHK